MRGDNFNFSLLIVTLAVVAVLKSADCSCIYGDVRFVGGSGDYEGNVQVCINGVWGYVCHHSWDTNDAKVVCGQLGYDTAYVSYRLDSYYGYGNGTISMDYVECAGSESKLTDCKINKKIGQTDCGYNEIAGAYCAFGVGGSNCKNGNIRLAHNYSDYNAIHNSRSEGRLEICFNNEWGTVCNNSWDSTDAVVVCTQLGFTSYLLHFHTPPYIYYGTGVGSIWLDDFACTSAQYNTGLLSCPHTVGGSGCTHSNDVKVRCYSQAPVTSCADGDVQLWSAFDSTPKNEGIPLACISGTWYPMRHDSTCYAFALACRSAGYSGVQYYESNGGQYYGYYLQSHWRYTCSSSATDLNTCSKKGFGSEWLDSIRVRCFTTDFQSTSCTNGDVQLTNGRASNEGRVEYCYNNEWIPTCSMDRYTAHSICKKLGYTSNVYPLIISMDDFLLSNLACLNLSSSLQCLSVLVSPSCNTSLCNVHYGLRCFDASTMINECTDGETRLVDGQIEQEGRLEVCVNGTWSQICDNGWSLNDAQVACASVGYSGSLGAIALVDSEFGAGYGPIVWNNVNCNHWNNDIHDCPKEVYPNFHCTTSDIAGVRCTEGCTDGDVRLVGGNSIHEGTVEICYDELWGLISDDGWNETDAKLVCKQLGYTGENIKPQLGSYYGKPNKTIHLKNVSCTTQDTSILKCASSQLTIADGKALWFNTEVAGVLCLAADTGSNDCVEDSVRLVDGSIKSEGRVEVCTKRRWLSVCEVGWDTTDGYVVCHQLGYERKEPPTLYYNSHFGNGSHPIVYTNVNCKGWEDSISDCDKDLTTTCHHTAGLRCKSSEPVNILGIIGLALGAVALVGVVIFSIIFIVMLIHFKKSSKRSMKVLPQAQDEMNVKQK